MDEFKKFSDVRLADYCANRRAHFQRETHLHIGGPQIVAEKERCLTKFNLNEIKMQRKL